MKQFYKLVFIFVVIIFSSHTVLAQGVTPSATLSVSNHFASNDTVYFDIVIEQSVSSLKPTYLSHSEFVFDFDEAQFTNPTVGVATHSNGDFYSTITTTSGAQNIMYDYGTVPTIGEVGPNSNRIIVDLAAPNFNESNSSDFDAKIAKIDKDADQILGRIFISGYNGGTNNVGLTWVTTGAENEMRTQVSSFDNSTYDSEHINLTYTAIGDLMEEVLVDAKIMLEGPFNGTDMNTDLNDLNLIPLSHPYSVAPWSYDGTEQVAAIPNANVVDWVYICLREADGPVPSATPNSIIARRAAFLLKDGSIVDLDGVSLVSFGFISPHYHDLFIEVYHRNHIPVVSATAISHHATGSYDYDFTTSISTVYNGAAGGKSLNGKGGMVTGDVNGDGEVLGSDRNQWVGANGGSGVYSNADMNMDGEVLGSDANQWKPNNGIVKQIP